MSEFRAYLAKYCLPLYVAAGILHLSALLFQWGAIAAYSKPALMMILLAWVGLSPVKRQARGLQALLTGALICSLAGDVSLEFYDGSADTSAFFLAGLGSFLLAHLCYLLIFIRLQKGYNAWIGQRIWVLIPFLIYMAGINVLINPQLGPALKLPVLLYSAIITTMALAALNLKESLPGNIFRRLLFGAMSFVASDTLLALRNFLPGFLPLPYPSFWVMATYIAAQGAIASALISYIRPERSE